MPAPLPAYEETAELVAFLPLLYAPGFAPIDRWHVDSGDRDDTLTFPWPEYNCTVLDFIRIAGSECWSDHQYRPEDAAKMIVNENVVRSASLAQIKSLLTYCVRGERFCDGHWAAMIEKGHVRRLLERLGELQLIAPSR